MLYTGGEAAFNGWQPCLPRRGPISPPLSARSDRRAAIADCHRHAAIGKMGKTDFASGFVETPGENPMSDRYAAYRRLKIDRPEERILRVMMDSPKRLNAADAAMHEELTHIWRDVDADPTVSAVIIRGAGEAFSAGGDLDLVQEMTEDFTVLTRVWKEARDLVYNLINCGKPIVSAMQGPAVGAGLVCGLLADVSIAAKSARIIDGHTRLGVAAGDHAAIVWPLLCGLAKAKYHLLLCEPLNGEEAERIGLVSLCVEDSELHEKSLEIARRLAAGSPTAIRWTKYALHNWLRLAGPTFDASLALEFLGFKGPDVREGIASLRERRRPNFTPDSPV
jgi:enoyl-CoA hydratase